MYSDSSSSRPTWATASARQSMKAPFTASTSPALVLAQVRRPVSRE